MYLFEVLAVYCPRLMISFLLAGIKRARLQSPQPDGLSADVDNPSGRQIPRANADTDINLLDRDADDRGNQVRDSLEPRV